MPRARRSQLMNCIHYLMENFRDYLISVASPSSDDCSRIRRIEMAGHDAGPWMRQAMKGHRIGGWVRSLAASATLAILIELSARQPWRPRPWTDDRKGALTK
jgi:hypothetical protein